YHPKVVRIAFPVAMRGDEPGQGWIEQQKSGKQGPDPHQHQLALQVVADLHLLLELVGGLIDVVVALGLEEEVTGLPGGHADQPSNEGGRRWIKQQQGVCEKEAYGTDQM